MRSSCLPKSQPKITEISALPNNELPFSSLILQLVCYWTSDVQYGLRFFTVTNLINPLGIGPFGYDIVQDAFT